jgi:hypothetical protein
MEGAARGRADAKANGVKLGRKPILTSHRQQEARKRNDRARHSAASPAAIMSRRRGLRGCRRWSCCAANERIPVNEEIVERARERMGTHG